MVAAVHIFVPDEFGVPLSSEPKRTLSSDRPNLSALVVQH
jgi:hypothetical protein